MWLFVYLLFVNGLVLLGLWLFARMFLRGQDLARYDQPAASVLSVPTDAVGGQQAVLDLIEDMRTRTRRAPFGRRLAVARELANQGFAGTPSDPDVLGVKVVEVSADGVAAEWVMAPQADPERRLLYIHGGAFTLGSPASHRAITSALSHRAGVAVLAIDYRLLPEHSRTAPVEDCRTAYRWILEHGPDGNTPARDVYIAGDSAGGNLTLVLLAWIRDRAVRPPAAAVALSPATDSTFQSPSLRANIASDALLGPALGRLMRVPPGALAWMTLLTTRMRPQHPVLSPIHGRLSGLPPVLVQASSSEMLRDDAIRYVNKARAEGAKAELELWPDMVHVWQLFDHVLPTAGAALQHIADFLNTHRAATTPEL